MQTFVDIVLASGKSAIQLALYVLLPIMVIMMALMKLFETKGILAGIARLIAPVLNRIGIPGIGVFAVLQLLLVSFAAPVATLSIMERDGTAKPAISATLAMVFCMSQANAIFPLLTVGLSFWVTIGSSLLGGMVAAKIAHALCSRATRNRDDQPMEDESGRAEDGVPMQKTAAYRVTGLTLKIIKMEGTPSAILQKLAPIQGRKVVGTAKFLALLEENLGYARVDRYKKLILKHAETGTLNLLINGGQEGVQIALKSIPILVLAIFFVRVLQEIGAIGLLESSLSPALESVGLPGIVVLPLATKYLAGGTAMMGIALNLVQEGALTALELNRIAGFLINPLDFVGVAVLVSAGPRVASVARPAAIGALAGILIRGILHLTFPWHIL